MTSNGALAESEAKVNADTFVSYIVDVLAQNFVTTAVMIPVVMLLCRAFRERPAVQNLLWLLVLVKFVTPPLPFVSWEVPASFSNAMSTIGDVRVQVQAVFGESVQHYAVVNAELMPTSPVDDVERAIALKGSRGSSTDNSTPHVIGVVILASCAGWLIGSFILSAVQARRIWQRFKLVQRGVAARGRLANLINGIARRLRLHGVPTLVVPKIASPFLCCFGRVRLVWPSALAEADENSIRAIIAHEAAHLRRGDHFVAWIELVASAIWWWNPLFWFARRQLRVTAEMSCDALALETFPDDRCLYAEMLLLMSASCKTGVPPLGLAIGSGAPSSLERRMKAIVFERVSGKCSIWGVIVVCGLAIAVVPAWSFAQTRSNIDLPPSASTGTKLFRQPTSEVATAVLPVVPELGVSYRAILPSANAAPAIFEANQFEQGRMDLLRAKRQRATAEAQPVAAQPQAADPASVILDTPARGQGAGGRRRTHAVSDVH